MAEMARMTAAQLADKLLSAEHADVVRESVAWMVAELMEAEVAAQIGAELGERTPDRVAHRNGYRPRGWETRIGELELRIPRLRQGSYFLSFLEPRRRAEQALVAVVQEAYVNGVSTRRVDRLVEQLGIAGMSKDQVSRLCRGLDEQVRVFRERPLQGRYPYLWLDAKVERVREPGGVRQKALVIAYGVHQTGRREVIGIDVGEAETEAFWREFLRSLRARGLQGVRLCISDAHQGLKQAIGQVLGCRWQRCTVHFLSVNRPSRVSREEVAEGPTLDGIEEQHCGRQGRQACRLWWHARAARAGAWRGRGPTGRWPTASLHTLRRGRSRRRRSAPTPTTW